MNIFKKFYLTVKDIFVHNIKVSWYVSKSARELNLSLKKNGFINSSRIIPRYRENKNMETILFSEELLSKFKKQIIDTHSDKSYQLTEKLFERTKLVG